MRTCIHAYAHTYMCMGIQVWTCVHKDSQHTYLTYTSTYIHNHIHVHSQVHTCIYIYLHNHRCMHPYPYKCMYTHTQKHIPNTPSPKLSSYKHNRHRVRQFHNKGGAEMIKSYFWLATETGAYIKSAL